MSLSRVIFSPFFGLLFVTPSFGQPSFRGLGSIPGGPGGTQALGISRNGLSVVGSGRSPSFPNEKALQTEAFRWTSDEGMIGLGQLPAPFDGGSLAYAASDDGSVVVGIGRYNDEQPTYSYRGFRWSAETGMTHLSTGSSWAFGITPDAHFAVGADYNNSHFIATRWGPSGELSLGVLPGVSGSFARAISADGSVIVGSSTPYGDGDYSAVAFRWTENGGMVSIGHLPGGPPPAHTKALAVSADGAVLVGNSRSNRGFEAFRWTEAAGMIGLGDLPGGDFSSVALGVSGDGRVVVGVATTGIDTTEAFIWDDKHGLRNLRTFLETDYRLDLNGWQLWRAVGISDDAMVIAGTGRNPQGRMEAWVADLRFCTTDWNRDTLINSQDFFDFLIDFFAGDADFDADGSTTSADFFAFVAAWLSGC